MSTDRVEEARRLVEYRAALQEGAYRMNALREPLDALIAAAEQRGREAERERWYSAMKLAVARAEFQPIDDRIAMSEAVNALGEHQP